MDFTENFKRFIDSTGWKIADSQWPISDHSELEKRLWYFCVEGVDGAGKSVFTKQFGTFFGVRQVRESDFKRPKNRNDFQDFHFARVMAYQTSHMAEEGHSLVTDRSVFSTLAYQNPSREQIGSLSHFLNSYIADECRLTPVLIWLDTPLDLAEKRLRERGEMDEVEKDRAFQKRVRQRYEEIWNDRPLDPAPEIAIRLQPK